MPQQLPNHLIQAFIDHGINPTTGRAALRQAFDDLKNEGADAKFSVNGVGTFHVQPCEKRYVIRDKKVWETPAQNRIKLRHAGAATVERSAYYTSYFRLTQSEPTQTEWFWYASSPDSDWYQSTPYSSPPNYWRFRRHVFQGVPTYLFYVNTMYYGDADQIDGYSLDGSNNINGLRFEHSLWNVFPRNDMGDYSFGELRVSSYLPPNGPEVYRDDPTNGKLALALARAKVRGI